MIVVYPLGNSDVQFIDTPLSKNTFREETFKIFEELKDGNASIITKKGTITKGLKIAKNSKSHEVYFPLLSELLEYLEEEESVENLSKVKYRFICTNQEGDRNKQDTVFAYEIIKFFLGKMGVKNIDKAEINGNPTDFDVLKGKYTELHKELKKLPETEHIIIVTGPGTPQMMISSLLEFSDLKNARYVYIPNNSKPYNLVFADEIRHRQIKDSVSVLVDKYDYRTAMLLYDELSPEEQKEKNLIESLALRVDFNFKESEECLNKYLRKKRNKPEQLKTFEKTLKGINSGNREYLLKELYYEFALRIETGHYLEAVAMLFRIEEEFLKKETEKHLHLKVDSYSNNFRAFWNDLNRESPELVQYLRSNGTKVSDAPNRITYKTILEYFKENGNTDSITARVLNLYHKLEEEKKTGVNMSLLDLRNKTPYAHGFEGVSKDKIEKIAFSPETLLNYIKDAFNDVGVKVYPPNDSEFPFKKINAYLIEQLKE